MPSVYIDDYIEVDVDEFIESCSDREINKIIKLLEERGELPKNPYLTIDNNGDQVDKRLKSEIDFSDKLDLLKNKFFYLNQEEEECLNNIFSKYI